jgi:hypothetical protein
MKLRGKFIDMKGDKKKRPSPPERRGGTSQKQIKKFHSEIVCGGMKNHEIIIVCKKQLLKIKSKVDKILPDLAFSRKDCDS